MKQSINEIEVNGVKYVPKDKENQQAETLDGMPYVIVRTYSAGVFAGYLKERNGREVTLLNARRLYYWDGAATLSQLAQEGVSKPENCQFPCEVTSILLLESIEIINCAERARLSIAEVKTWQV